MSEGENFRPMMRRLNTDRQMQQDDLGAEDLWERAQGIFLAALSLPVSERSVFVKLNAAGDDLLLEEVESLLAHDDEDAEIADVFHLAAAKLIEAGSLVGERIGPYQITAELGQGGMGAVYLAVRADDEYRMQVAVKLVKRGMDTERMLERFRRERQILANLHHPYIARLMDGGTTQDDQPYFVLEYVDGQPIDEFCRSRQLRVEQCCKLFLRVCDAVSYAHRNLVVHRDLKPSNVFVIADGTPKLLDFGVAKLLTPDADTDISMAGLGPRPLTPEYASPEQFLGLTVTTATDVYSLGVVLYELLTGAKAQQVSGRTITEMERIICQAEVLRPSARNKELSGDLDNILLMAMSKQPERRYSSVEQFAADIQRFLDGLPVIARKDSIRYRASKYIRRNWLVIAAATVVAACLVGSTVVTLVQSREAHEARLLAETSRRTAERERARAEERSAQANAARDSSDREHAVAEIQRAIAQSEADKAKDEQRVAEQRLTQLVQLANSSLFDVHSAIEQLPGATAARELIVKTTLKYLESVANDAGTDDHLALALGAAYWRVGDIQGNPNMPSLGDTAGALTSYALGMQLMDSLRSRRPRDPDVMSVWVDLETSRGIVFNARGQSATAVELLERALPVARLLGEMRPGDAREANVHQCLLMALQYAHPEQALDQGRAAIESYAKVSREHPGDREARWGLSGVHSLVAANIAHVDRVGALEHYRESARLRETLVAEEPNNVSYQRSLMLAYGQVGSNLGDVFGADPVDVEGARSFFSKALAIAKYLNEVDPMNRVARYDLASAELRLGALTYVDGGQESYRLLKHSCDLFEELQKSDSKAIRYQRGLATSHEFLGRQLQQAGQNVQALAEYEKSVTLADATLLTTPGDRPTVVQAIAAEEAIASLYATEGDRTRSVDYARRSVLRSEKLRKSSDTPQTKVSAARAYLGAAAVYRQLSDWREARVTAERAAAIWLELMSEHKTEAYVKGLRRAEDLISECDAHHQ